MPTLITRGGMSVKAMGFGASTGVATYVEDVFSTWLYTGNGSTQTITNNIDLSTKGGMVWCKSRSGADPVQSHNVGTTALGVSGSNTLRTNQTAAAFGNGTQITAFNTNGFSVGSYSEVNASATEFVSWTFRKQPKFFDVVTYTGTGSARTIAHSLASTPGMIIVKRTDTTGNWQVYHSGLTSAAYSIQLNLTNAQASATTVWNSTAPTSSVFSVGTDATVNASGGTYVAYVFATSGSGGFGADGTQDIISCGSFTTSGETAVNLGWEPQYVLVKRIDAAQNWYVFDNMRGMSVSNSNNYLFSNSSAAEGSTTSSYYGVKPTATGFVAQSLFFGNGYNYIYLAIRRGPMKTPTDATKVFYPFTGHDTSAVTTGFPVDMFIEGDLAGGSLNSLVGSRLVGSDALVTSSSGAEQTLVNSTAFQSNTTYYNPIFGVTPNVMLQLFQRAPGFFDEVCYTGTSGVLNVSHNLGVAPELMIIKNRNTSSYSWAVYAASLPTPQTNFMLLNYNFGGLGPDTAFWNSTNPTSTVFTVATNGSVNTSGNTYVAYLFATCAGVSKVGSYTGTGAAQNINCGFSGGTRFVLIKRMDTTGDWYVYDSARGISSGNDPYLLLNSTAAQVTTTNYVDTYSAGFTLTSSAPAGLNASGGSYLFLAIA